MNVIVLKFTRGFLKNSEIGVVNESMGVRDSRRCWIGYP